MTGMAHVVSDPSLFLPIGQPGFHHDVNVRKILHGDLVFADTEEKLEGLNYNHVVEVAVMRASPQGMHDDRDTG